ncbi:MAG TPA: RNA 2',3'-cyclic phosphodiesterase [Longimicrobiales bacterium]|nr:RNA 2',3'-cyclic phosphodiesterase [Longimicrobiales bacterium]
MRGFVAVNLPEPLRLEMAAALAPLVQSSLPVRWLEASAYHLTLKFLGEVADAALPAVVDALTRVAARHAPFTLSLAGAGAFPSRGRPAIFWIGVAAHDRLAALQHSVEQGIAPLGFPAEPRRFHPHITVGRTRRDAPTGTLRDAASLLDRITYDACVEIGTVDLMRSHLSPRGARYECVLAAPLAA